MKKILILLFVLSIILPVVSANENISLNRENFTIPDGFNEREMDSTYPIYYFFFGGGNMGLESKLYTNNNRDTITIMVDKNIYNSSIDDYLEDEYVNKSINGREGYFLKENYDTPYYTFYYENNNKIIMINSNDYDYIEQVVN